MTDILMQKLAEIAQEEENSYVSAASKNQCETDRNENLTTIVNERENTNILNQSELANNSLVEVKHRPSMRQVTSYSNSPDAYYDDEN